MLTIVPLAGGVAAACLLTIILVIVVRRRRQADIMALRWENATSKNSFVRKCRYYLKAEGWGIRPPWAGWTDLLVSKEGQEVHLMCADPARQLDKTVLFLCYESAIGCGQCVLLLTWSEPSEKFRVEATSKRVPLLYYKDLPGLLDYVRGFAAEQRLQAFPTHDRADGDAAAAIA